MTRVLARTARRSTHMLFSPKVQCAFFGSVSLVAALSLDRTENLLPMALVATAGAAIAFRELLKALED